MLIKTEFGQFNYYKDLLNYLRLKQIPQTRVTISFFKGTSSTLDITCDDLERIVKYEW